MNCVLLALIFARLLNLNHKKRRRLRLAHNNDDAGQPAARDYESSDRIGMIHMNRSDYLRTRRAQAAVNYSNSLAF